MLRPSPLIASPLSMAAGVVVIALPDDGGRLVTLGEGHGPSALDAAGIALLLAGWAALLPLVARGWSALAGARARALVMAALTAGAAILVPAVVLGLGAWWVPGVLLMSGAQAWLFTRGLAARARRAPSSPPRAPRAR